MRADPERVDLGDVVQQAWPQRAIGAHGRGLGGGTNTDNFLAIFFATVNLVKKLVPLRLDLAGVLGLCIGLV